MVQWRQLVVEYPANDGTLRSESSTIPASMAPDSNLATTLLFLRKKMAILLQHFHLLEAKWQHCYNVVMR